MSRVILGVDPGTRKAGYAVVDGTGEVLCQGIEELEQMTARVAEIGASHKIAAVALGTGTNADRLHVILAALGVPVYLVDERETTLRARALYFADNPPRGWRRLVPLGMQLPPRPIDDYAAVLIARRYLADEDKPKNLLN
jgi:RNase H-fold protein (predicted Holliday junction resolvase)